jgi:hypothetical protein
MPLVIDFIGNNRQIKEIEIGMSYLQQSMNFQSCRINSGLEMDPLKKKSVSYPNDY